MVWLIEKAHEDGGHCGAHALHKRIELTWTGISRTLCAAYVKRCHACAQKIAKHSKHTIIRPIRSGKFNQHVQMDLIDMQSAPGGPDRDYRYIFHWKDVFSKLSLLRPIKNKTAECVRDVLLELITTVGPPTKLQSDNGSEFKNELVDNLCTEFNITRSYGRAYHPQANGNVERANGDAQKKLAIWVSTQKSAKDIMDWIPGLYRVQWAMNSQFKRSLKRTPYELVFNRQPINDPMNSNCASSELFTEEEEQKEDEYDEDKDMAEREQIVEESAANLAAYQDAYTAAHNARKDVIKYKAGDFVWLTLQSKGLTALSLPRQMFMVVKAGSANTYQLYCTHGMLKNRVGAERLELVPANMVPEEMKE